MGTLIGKLIEWVSEMEEETRIRAFCILYSFAAFALILGMNFMIQGEPGNSVLVALLLMAPTGFSACFIHSVHQCLEDTRKELKRDQVRELAHADALAKAVANAKAEGIKLGSDIGRRQTIEAIKPLLVQFKAWSAVLDNLDKPVNPAGGLETFPPANPETPADV